MSAFYPVQDDRNNLGSMNYTYFFNVCDNINFDYFRYVDACNVTYPGANSPDSSAVAGPAPAFQLANFPVPDRDRCHKLGQDLTQFPGSMTWGLYEPTNPSMGVVLSYTGGDRCPNRGTTTRSLRLWLNCYNDQGGVPRDEVVLESGACQYDIFVNSAFGCPVECPLVPTSDGKSKYLCARHGVVR